MKNLQGDIIGILDNNLAQVVSYTYDSWGKLISIKDTNGNEITDTTNIGLINPYRYRSYRYDAETELYYLNSRYYNPEWGRFINGDGYGGQVGELLSHNVYAYCLNNPINLYDPNGNSPLFAIINKIVGTIKEIANKAVEVLIKVAKTETVKNIIKKYDYSDELNKLIDKNIAIVSSKSAVLDIVWFKNQVDNRGPWDYKRKESWERDISKPFLGYNGIFKFNGMSMTAEQFGNLHYGIVGTAMGYSPNILFMGGGYANVGFVSFLFQWPPYWGDSEEDHYYIQLGIDYYNTYKK